MKTVQAVPAVAGLARYVLEIGGGQAGQAHVLRRVGDEVALGLAVFSEVDAVADVRAGLHVAGRPQPGGMQRLQAQPERALRVFAP